MKRNVVNVLTTGVIGLLALFSLAACGTNQADEETTVVKLGVVGEQNEAWEHVQEELKEKIFSGEIEDAKTVSSLMAYAVKYGK